MRKIMSEPKDSKACHGLFLLVHDFQYLFDARTIHTSNALAFVRAQMRQIYINRPAYMNASHKQFNTFDFSGSPSVSIVKHGKQAACPDRTLP
jgi:hypothetical protein